MNDVTMPPTAPDGNTDAVGAAIPLPPASSGGARRVIGRVLPAVLVVAAIAGAAVYTSNTVDAADRSAGTRLWKKPAHKPGKDPAGEVARGRASTELSKLLLPVPSGYRLGPDLGELGNDGEQSGAKATAAMKESARGLAGKERRAYEKRIDKLRIEGIAVRSYTADSNDLLINTEMVRMKDKKAVQNLYTFRTGFRDSIGLFREGPKIKGHTRNARCFVLREDSEDSEDSGDAIESMDCLAYDGELSISVSASGTKPFARSAVAELLKDQLDHIASPGEYV
ncbi:hypothetical protein AB0L71_24790 [Streptomyces sp. NPDC052052]|uniref:hypothetical protein n=1 Tax=Streptomyces sp. NPDC052052 TaxID=3154756 RepID=UPI0034364051